jgi:hypothetical protein
MQCDLCSLQECKTLKAVRAVRNAAGGPFLALIDATTICASWEAFTKLWHAPAWSLLVSYLYRALAATRVPRAAH